MSVAANLACIKSKLGQAPVKIVAVSKYVGLDGIKEAFACGVTHFGENKVQDALDKLDRLPADISKGSFWHFIGHLQTNKVKKVVGRFCLIHSVDSLRLAKEISAQARKADIVQPVLLQVKVLEDPSKSGFSPEDLNLIFSEIAELPNIEIRGLMAMAPLSSEPNIATRCFDGLRNLARQLEAKTGHPLPELSMGMSDDWEEALKCGATILRLGRAIFEN